MKAEKWNADNIKDSPVKVKMKSRVKKYYNCTNAFEKIRRINRD